MFVARLTPDEVNAEAARAAGVTVTCTLDPHPFRPVADLAGSTV
jgi:hypothetical protein